MKSLDRTLRITGERDYRLPISPEQRFRRAWLFLAVGNCNPLLILPGLQRSCIAVGDECFQASRLSDQSVWFSSMSDDEALIVKKRPFLNVVCVRLAFTYCSSDANDGETLFRPMLPAFSLTICSSFREYTIKPLCRYEREVAAGMPEPHTFANVTARSSERYSAPPASIYIGSKTRLAFPGRFSLR